MQFYEAAIKKANSLDGKALAAALVGTRIDTPFGFDGTITMRDDHTTIGYAIGWGQTIPKEPFIVDVKAADWGKIIELETEWKKQQNYI
jgi:branched-chain amino acid transport system substrate-binding protein